MPNTLNLLFRSLPLITLEGKERTFTAVDPKELLQKKSIFHKCNIVNVFGRM